MYQSQQNCKNNDWKNAEKFKKEAKKNGWKWGKIERRRREKRLEKAGKILSQIFSNKREAEWLEGMLMRIRQIFLLFSIYSIERGTERDSISRSDLSSRHHFLSFFSLNLNAMRDHIPFLELRVKRSSIFLPKYRFSFYIASYFKYLIFQLISFTRSYFFLFRSLWFSLSTFLFLIRLFKSSSARHILTLSLNLFLFYS